MCGKIKLPGAPITHTLTFCYLGSIISESGGVLIYFIVVTGPQFATAPGGRHDPLVIYQQPSFLLHTAMHVRIPLGHLNLCMWGANPPVQYVIT